MSVTHGLASTYRSKARCRCEACRIANGERQADEQRSRARRLAADPSLAPHGRTSTYTNWGCRCDDCRQAESVYRARRRADGLD